MNGRTDGRTTGLRELDKHIQETTQMPSFRQLSVIDNSDTCGKVFLNTTLMEAHVGEYTQSEIVKMSP